MKDYILASIFGIGFILICIACFCIHYIIGLIVTGIVCIIIACTLTDSDEYEEYKEYKERH